jgi:hypothetical protein
MRYLAVHGLALLISTVASPTLAAATAFVEAQAYDVESGQGNSDYQLGQTTASASYSNPEGGSASAFATIGSTTNGGLSMKVFATGTAGEFVSNRGSASLGWDDRIRTTGTLLDILIDLEFKFTGSASGAANVEASVSACVDSNCNLQLANGPATFHITAADLISPSETATLSIILSASATGTAITGPSSSTADFSHSLDLVSITPRDALGNVVPGISFVSESGFNYNAVVVPEPNALLLFLSALAFGTSLAIPTRRSRL